MLGQRIVTAVVLLTILLAAFLVQPKWPLLVFMSVAVSIAAFEWLRITLPDRVGLAWIVSLGLLAITLFQSWQWHVGQPISLNVLHVCVAIAAFMWLCVIPVLTFTAKPSEHPLRGWALFAPVCLYATWGVLALTWVSSGAWAVISLLVIIWVADIFAYFGGRQFGRHKLAPSISPGKTREGALIGLAGVLLWMLISAQWPGSYAADVMARWGVLGVIVVAVLLGSVSVLGDLFESLLKRRAGVKDSGRLLPGHGGVYDRVDAVVAVVPVAYLLVYDFWYR
jgi:phosphatidate cytidylyltransferase